jgi:hypothetical protein
MAFPTITFNSSTGSDTAASGSGGTALTAGGNDGASSTASSATVDLSADAPDLSGVATDGSAVLWVDSSSGRQFSAISSVNNTLKTVTCADTFANTESGRNWGIGGKRATLDNADSRTLFGSQGGTTGAKPGWTIVTETDQALTSTLNCTLSTALSTDGMPVIKSDGTRRTINISINDEIFGFGAAIPIKFENLKFTNSNGTKTSAYLANYSNNATPWFHDCVIGDATNQLLGTHVRVAAECLFKFTLCEICHCTGSGVPANQGGTEMYFSRVHHNGGGGISTSSSGGLLTLIGNLITDNTGDGIKLTTAALPLRTVLYNTIDGNSGDGIDLSASTAANNLLCLFNNITNNGNFGIRGTTGSDTQKLLADFNNVWNNTSGNYTSFTAGASDKSVDPGYVDAANEDYRITESTLKSLQFPASGYIGINSLTNSFGDIGASQSLITSSGGATVPTRIYGLEGVAA